MAGAGKLQWAVLEDTPSTFSSPPSVPSSEASGPEGEMKLETVMQKTTIASDSKDEEDAMPVTVFEGLHPNDATAQVSVTGAKDSIYKAAETFPDLKLTKELLDGVYAMKFVTPSKIQAQALPIILAEKRPNFIGQAHHGSGKTAAYALSMLTRVDTTKQVPQCLCVCPVRELAKQVVDVVKQLGKYTRVTVLEAIPGSDRDEVTSHIVVGTPGTILNKIRYKQFNPASIIMFVLDEADEMVAKQGLGDQTVQLKNYMPRSCQIVLFSATFPDKVASFVKVVAPNAVTTIVKREELSLDNVAQFAIDCGAESRKYQALTNLYGLLNLGQAIIFVHTVKTAKELTNRMRQEGYTVSILHGKDMDMAQRDKTMNDFRTGKSTILITTNVLARGIDVLQVMLVVNYDVPLDRFNKPDPETYIHRIGRSGRFGRKGVAINLVADERSKTDLRAIENYFKKPIKGLHMDNFAAIEEAVKIALGKK